MPRTLTCVENRGTKEDIPENPQQPALSQDGSQLGLSFFECYVLTIQNSNRVKGRFNSYKQARRNDPMGTEQVLSDKEEDLIPDELAFNAMAHALHNKPDPLNTGPSAGQTHIPNQPAQPDPLMMNQTTQPGPGFQPPDAIDWTNVLNAAQGPTTCYVQIRPNLRSSELRITARLRRSGFSSCAAPRSTLVSSFDMAEFRGVDEGPRTGNVYDRSCTRRLVRQVRDGGGTGKCAGGRRYAESIFELN